MTHHFRKLLIWTVLTATSTSLFVCLVAVSLHLKGEVVTVAGMAAGVAGGYLAGSLVTRDRKPKGESK